MAAAAGGVVTVFGEALAHLTRSLIREGNGHNLPSRNTILDEVNNPLGQYTGLATTGTSQDKQGSIEVSHGLSLLRVKLYFRLHTHS